MIGFIVCSAGRRMRRFGPDGDEALMRCAIRVTLSAATFAVSIAVLAVTPVQAQKQFGAAGVLCSQYIKGARTSDIIYHQASNWLLGYVSGMNAAQSANGAAPGVNLTNDQVRKSAAHHCPANPSATL